MDIAGGRSARRVSAATAAYATIIGLLGAHYVLSSVNQLGADLTIVAAGLPIAVLTAARGLPAGIVGLAIMSLAPIDSVQLGLADAVAEFCAIAAAGLFGCGLGIAIGQEAAAHDRTLRIVTERLRRLKGPPGYWHTAATTRTGLYVTGFEADFISEALAAREPGVVADIGAGSGRLAFAMAPHAKVVVATEIDIDELALTEDDYGVTPVAVGAGETLPFRDASLDWVVAIEAPAVSEQAWFMEECRRVLKPGGGLVLMVYNGRSYKGLAARMRRALRAGPHWTSMYYQQPLASHLRQWADAGFPAVRKQGFYWAPVGRVSNSPLVTVTAVLERVAHLWRLAAVSPWVMVELRKRD